MIRTNISLTRELYEWIRNEAHRLGISIAKYIRNLIEEKKNASNTR